MALPYGADTFNRAPTVYNSTGLDDLFKNYKAGAESMYVPRDLQNEAIGKELDNVMKRIQGENEEARLKSGIAQAYSAAGLNTANTKTLNAQLPYISSNAQIQQALHRAQTEQAQAKAQQLMQKIDLLKQLGIGIGGSQGGEQVANTMNPGNFVEQSAPTYGQLASQASQGEGQSRNVFGGIDAKELRNLLGFSQLGIPAKTEYLQDKEGHLIKLVPGMAPQKILIGKSEAELAGESTKATERAKANQEYLTENAQAYESSISQERDLSLIDSMLDDPRIKEAVGPLNKYIGKYFPDQDIQELQGKFEAVTGDLVLSMSKAFGPRFTDNDLRFVQNQKPGVGDTAARIKGKTNVLRTLARAAAQKTKLVNNYIEQNGLSRIEANDLANGQVDIAQIMKDLRIESKQRETARQDEKYLGKYSIGDIEKTAELKGWTVEETKRRLKEREENK